jgi:hypothetical protein
MLPTIIGAHKEALSAPQIDPQMMGVSADRGRTEGHSMAETESSCTSRRLSSPRKP